MTTTDARKRHAENAARSLLKPPLGIVPKHLHDARRVGDLQAAITRYKQAGWDVPAAWLTELDDLLEGTPR